MHNFHYEVIRMVREQFVWSFFPLADFIEPGKIFRVPLSSLELSWRPHIGLPAPWFPILLLMTGKMV